MFFWMDTLFPVFFFAITAIVVATFVVIFVKGIREWNHNNHSPVLTVPAKVVAKREHRSHNSAAGDDIVHTSTSYYATFEVESGDRMEPFRQGIRAAGAGGRGKADLSGKPLSPL